MTNEDFDRRMEFILDQQARFASDIQQLQESQARTERNVTRTEQVVAQLADVTQETLTTMLEGFRDVNARIEALAEAQSRTEERFRETDAKINALVDSQIRLEEAQLRTEESLRKTDAKIEALAESQSRTEESLRRLSDTVDRHLREGRNGGSQADT